MSRWSAAVGATRPSRHGCISTGVRWCGCSARSVTSPPQPDRPGSTADVGGVGRVPTIELTVQVRRRPAPGFLSAWFTTEAITAGYLEEDGAVWDAAGDLVVLSRQLALAARAG
jgi:hypothetical protein